MTEYILFFLYGTMVLLFGVFMSCAFAGIRFTRRNLLVCLAVSAVSGIAQIVVYITLSGDIIWKLYPVISHLPVIIMLCGIFRKKIATAAASLFTAYLCCQPSKWFGLLFLGITGSENVQYIVRIAVLMAVAAVTFIFFKDYVAEIYNKDVRSVCILGITPAVYYIFDYVTVVYLDIFNWNNPVVVEFLPFFLCIIFMTFCLIYYKEYELKSDAERKEQIIKVTLAEQKKELDAVKRSEQEIRILRHDMRLLLGNIAVCIDNNDSETARKLISAYTDSIDSTVVKKYCSNTTINYIVSSFADKCHENNIDFICHIDADSITCDEIMLSTIISNAMDNAINAQLTVPAEQRKIQLMLKNHNDKLLLSIKNPFAEKPDFVGGIPLSRRKGHGYGTQSIVYLTERMGGNCQFTTDGNNFVLRVII